MTMLDLSYKLQLSRVTVVHKALHIAICSMCTQNDLDCLLRSVPEAAYSKFLTTESSFTQGLACPNRTSAFPLFLPLSAVIFSHLFAFQFLGGAALIRPPPLSPLPLADVQSSFQ